MSNVQFFVPGVPAPGGSKKGFYIKKINRVVMTPASKKTKPWMDSVKWAAIQAFNRRCLFEGALRFTFEFRMLRPQGHYGTGSHAAVLKKSARPYPTVRPDLTKLVRAAEDALTGVIWRDDSSVVQQQNSKIYVGKNPGVQIYIGEIEDEPISDKTEQKGLYPV